MNRAWASCLAILAVAAALRFPKLADRPMHADEAVLADKFGTLLETGSYQYDPRDFHGPLLAAATLVPARIAGVRRYVDLTETTLRSVPAFCGLLLVLAPLLLRDALGRWEAIAACALTAVSPAMVYYSRYYIPEMLLTLLTLAAIVAAYRYSRTQHPGWAFAAGAALGLMLAAKETGAIAGACILVAAAVSARPKPRDLWHAAAALAIAAAIAVLLLGFSGSWRAVGSYFQRGFHDSLHRHPWHYYFGLLAGSEALILVLAAVGLFRAQGFARFLAIYAGAMWAVYSVIPYKTPWCVLGPLQATTLLAGVGLVAAVRMPNRFARMSAAVVLTACAALLGFQAWWAAFPYSSDPRNPYVYAHTGRDVYAIRDAVARLADAHPDGRRMAIQVVSGQNLWPLPWYLRPYPRVQWWRGLDQRFRPADVILVTPEMEPALTRELYETPPPGERELYLSMFDRYVELRPGVEIRGYVRASQSRRAGEKSSMLTESASASTLCSTSGGTSIMSPGWSHASSEFTTSRSAPDSSIVICSLGWLCGGIDAPFFRRTRATVRFRPWKAFRPACAFNIDSSSI